MEIMTVNDLYRECVRLRKAGKGNKKVLLVDDDEGNGYHSCFFGIQDKQEVIDEYADLFHDRLNPKDVVLLG